MGLAEPNPGFSNFIMIMVVVNFFIRIFLVDILILHRNRVQLICYLISYLTRDLFVS